MSFYTEPKYVMGKGNKVALDMLRNQHMQKMNTYGVQSPLRRK